MTSSAVDDTIPEDDVPDERLAELMREFGGGQCSGPTPAVAASGSAWPMAIIASISIIGFSAALYFEGADNRRNQQLCWEGSLRPLLTESIEVPYWHHFRTAEQRVLLQTMVDRRKRDVAMKAEAVEDLLALAHADVVLDRHESARSYLKEIAGRPSDPRMAALAEVELATLDGVEPAMKALGKQNWKLEIKPADDFRTIRIKTFQTVAAQAIKSLGGDEHKLPCGIPWVKVAHCAETMQPDGPLPEIGPEPAPAPQGNPPPPPNTRNLGGLR